MSPIALLFPGQGAQHVGMGRDLRDASPAATAIFAQADEILARPLTRLMWEGPEDELTRTGNCQPALYVHGLAALAALREALGEGAGTLDGRVVGAAGLSLGELTAHGAAGTYDFAHGLRLVARRGELMDAACAAAPGGMVALLGGDAEKARALAEASGTEVANYNTPGQYVLSGTLEGTQKAAAEAKAHGFRRAAPLKVAGAYHSRLMEPARLEFAAALAHAAGHFRAPHVPVVANRSAMPARVPSDILTLLADQVTHSVRWVECIELLATELGATLFLELGPGNTLAGMVPRIVPGVEVMSAGDAAGVKAMAERLKGEK